MCVQLTARSCGVTSRYDAADELSYEGLVIHTLAFLSRALIVENVETADIEQHWNQLLRSVSLGGHEVPQVLHGNVYTRTEAKWSQRHFERGEMSALEWGVSGRRGRRVRWRQRGGNGEGNSLFHIPFSTFPIPFSTFTGPLGNGEGTAEGTQQ